MISHSTKRLTWEPSSVKISAWNILDISPLDVRNRNMRVVIRSNGFLDLNIIVAYNICLKAIPIFRKAIRATPIPKQSAPTSTLEAKLPGSDGSVSVLPSQE